MTGEEAALALRALRLLRRGSLDPTAAPEILHLFLADGVGPACDHFARWIRYSAEDERAAEAALRFFGLDRLPEDLRQIGATLVPRHPNGHAGVGPRQVERLVSNAVATMASRSLSPADEPSQEPPQPLRDPFPLPHPRPLRRWVTQVVVWAWAQVPAGNRTAADALLYYEHEHALRAHAPVPSSRMERHRWRRLAWSVLPVAAHRATQAAHARTTAGMHAPPGDHLPAVTAGTGQASGLIALTALCADPSPPAAADLMQAALEFVRTAVREGRHEAPQLLALARDTMKRHQAVTGSLPPALESRLITLSAITARERRDPAGVSLARAGLRRIDELLAAQPTHRDHGSWAAHVESGYRTSQELADLCLSLSRFTEARAAVATMRARLQHSGDPDPSYLPEGWHWNLLVTQAAVDRHLARASGCAQPLLRAATITAQRAAELRAAMGLPASWAVAAENEIIAAALDRLDDPAYRTSPHGRRLHAEIAGRLRQIDHHTQHIDDWQNRDTRRALLHARLLAWRLALQQGDPVAIQTAQAQAKQQLQPSTTPILPIDADQITRYERVTREHLRPPQGPARQP
ncbi:MAG: hypothetical protein ACRDNF_10805 [Streptosporangiaceae bacterium]